MRLEQGPHTIPEIAGTKFRIKIEPRAMVGRVAARRRRFISAGLQDARLAALRRSGPDGTSSGFNGSTDGRRIDWIFYGGGIKAVASDTVVFSRNGRYPSDHFPVVAVFEWQQVKKW